MNEFLKFIFGLKLYMFRTVPLSIIRRYFTVNTHNNGICHTGLLTTCEHDQDGFHPDRARKQSANLHDIYHCCVYSEKPLMMDRGTVRNMYSFNPKISLRNWCI